MNEADQAMMITATEALAAGKTVMVAIRGLHATPILDLRSSSSDGALVTLICPASDELGVGESELTIRASDLLGVSVFV